MGLVLSERDYKLLTLFTKVAGIFTFAAGTITMIDHGRPWFGLLLVGLGIVIALAPVPMSVVRPEDPEDLEGAAGASGDGPA